MARFTKEVRRRIVEDFASRHGGVFDASVFLAEVKSAGEKHEAFSWFEWDNAKAADEFRVDQARAFVRDLRISVRIETMGPNRSLQVRTVESPLAVSPSAGRANGGGYSIIDAESPESRRILCQEASTALAAFHKRYGLAVIVAGIPEATMMDLIARLEDAGGKVDGKVVRVAEG
jgi:hypothetical protein